MEPTISGVAGDQKATESRWRLPLVIVALVLFAALAAGSRYSLRQKSALPTGDSAWSVQLSVQAQARDEGAVIRIAPPWDTRHIRVFSQAASHPGMRRSRSRAPSAARDIILVSTRAGDLHLALQFDLHLRALERPLPSPGALVDRAEWLVSEPGIPVEAREVATLLNGLPPAGSEPALLVRRLFELVSERIRIEPRGSDDGGTALRTGRASPLGATRALVTLLRGGHLPARTVTGLNLLAPDNQRLRHWGEVYIGDTWQAFDVEAGHLYTLPAGYVPFRRGGPAVAIAEDGRIYSSQWRIRTAPPPAGLLARANEPGWMEVIDLTRLSPRTREILALLLLLPLGALWTEALRQIVGIRTYGTFTPSLLALAAVFVDWATAAIVFGLVTVIGIAGRSMLPGLGLPRVPRLGIVFTLVALAMALVVSLLMRLDPSADGAVVLLPIVILTNTVDRFYAVADESGVRIALMRLAWTVTVALGALWILLQTHWGEWLTAYPEMHALTVAAMILLGKYRGQRLAERPGLGWLLEPRKPAMPAQAGDQPPAQAGPST